MYHFYCIRNPLEIFVTQLLQCVKNTICNRGLFYFNLTLVVVWLQHLVSFVKPGWAEHFRTALSFFALEHEDEKSFYISSWSKAYFGWLCPACPIHLFHWLCMHIWIFVWSVTKQQQKKSVTVCWRPAGECLGNRFVCGTEPMNDAQ